MSSIFSFYFYCCTLQFQHQISEKQQIGFYYPIFILAKKNPLDAINLNGKTPFHAQSIRLKKIRLSVNSWGRKKRPNRKKPLKSIEKTPLFIGEYKENPILESIEILYIVDVPLQNPDPVVTPLGEPVCVGAEEEIDNWREPQFRHVSAYFANAGISLSSVSSTQSENSFFCLSGSVSLRIV